MSKQPLTPQEAIEQLLKHAESEAGQEYLRAQSLALRNLISLAEQARDKQEFLLFVEGIEALQAFPPGAVFWYFVRYGEEYFEPLRLKAIKLGFFTEAETRH